MNNQTAIGGQQLNLHPDILNAYNNWLAYTYVYEKYRKFLDALPIYKGSGKTSRTFWWCWLQGIENAPPICKICLESLNRHYPDYAINIVSFKDINNGIVTFPKHIVDKFNAGKISPTQMSDILRLELLINYGGIWIDSCVLATGREPYYLHYPLFIFQGTWRNQPAHLGSSWFIVSESESPILKTTRDLLYKFWEEHDSINGALYFVFHLMFKLATEKYPNDWEKVPRFSNVPPHILQFEFFSKYTPERFEQIKSMSNFHKLTWKYPAEKLAAENIKGTLAEYVFTKF